jgi:hypothetical protein
MLTTVVTDLLCIESNITTRHGSSSRASDDTFAAEQCSELLDYCLQLDLDFEDAPFDLSAVDRATHKTL